MPIIRFCVFLLLVLMPACRQASEKNYKKAIETVNRINQPLNEKEQQWMDDIVQKVSCAAPKEIESYKQEAIESSLPLPVKLERGLTNSCLRIRISYLNSKGQRLIAYVFVNPVRPIVDELGYCSFKAFRFEQSPEYVWQRSASCCLKPKILGPISANVISDDIPLVEKKNVYEGFIGAWRLEGDKVEYSKYTLDYQESTFRSKLTGVWFLVLSDDSGSGLKMATELDDMLSNKAIA